MDYSRDAAEQMKRVQGNVKNYADFVGTFGPFGLDTFYAVMGFAPGPVVQGGQIGISELVMLNSQGLPVVYKQSTSVSVLTVDSTYFSFTTAKDHPLDGTISFPR